MTLLNLPLPVLRLCAVVFYLLSLSSLFCVALAFRLPSAKAVFACGLLGGLLTFPVATFLPLYFVRLLSGQPPEDHIRSFLSLPVWMVGLLAVLSLAAIVWMIVRLRRLQRSVLTAQSLCEGLDQLPDGICYSLPDGFPKMVNSRMQAIGNAAFGVGVTDTRQLDERLKSRDLQPGCTVDEEENTTFLRLPDGKVWHLKQQQVTTTDRPMGEMIAYDVTERYYDLIELRTRNARLEETNRQLSSYLQEIDAIVREREILDAKIRFHNRLGQCLLVLRSYLTGMETDRKTVDEQLQHTVSLLQNNGPDSGTGDKLQAVLIAAEVIGVEIRIRGEVPPPLHNLFAVAVHECLTNTVKHAHGHLLEADITQDEAQILITLQNDGAPPKGPVKETGGLANLRIMAEKNGGTMEIESTPVFRLCLRFDRTEEESGSSNHPAGGEFV